MIEKKLIKKWVVKILGYGLFLTFFSISAYAKPFQVQITTQPNSPNESFIGKIVAADFNDPTPNYCYGKSNCYYAAFVNSKSWGENGRAGYSTIDTERVSERISWARSSSTMGELARALAKNDLLYMDMRDYLPASEGNDPIFCVYAAYSAGRGQQIPGTLVSNCADAPVSPTACTLTPESIEFNWGVVTNIQAGEIELSKPVSITCTRQTRIGLSISGDYIPLNGDKNTRAEFDLGNGWTGKTQVNVCVNESKNVQIKSRLVGLERQQGDFTGSSVLIMEQL
ncbi:hypothetical protein UXO62_01405 [Enterobacter cloacae]|uniref:MrpH family fimbial adhesin n=1 Tax=Enterobacter cloacae TaxID=550 RepID=UPI002FD6E7E7